ncbi:MAG: membrane protein insertion efficiency factor YidD [Candidatus Stahlbacteria bacterium]|nr:membrane protein insertion efficiency factor YidD [candidate division WOR-3 bacterium]TET99904.1 MAG: membrane protein insertion efficiency factor YidD [Candidatus Stahlbacteria bacterium]
MAKLMVSIIRFYSKYLSTLFPRHCRYYPTCSSYAVNAFKRKGFFKGLILSIWRILRCNPFSPGGYDPVR